MDRKLITILKYDFAVLLSCDSSVAPAEERGQATKLSPIFLLFPLFPSSPVLSPITHFLSFFIQSFESHSLSACLRFSQTEDAYPKRDCWPLPRRNIFPKLKICPISFCNCYIFSNLTLKPSLLDINTAPALLPCGD